MGLETVGSSDPALDAEVIWLAWSAYESLGLSRAALLLNSLGCRECRPAYQAALQTFLAGLDLDDATRQRAAINPMRVLDDKRPEVRKQLVGAPVMTDHLCAACAAHHDAVRNHLGDLGIGWRDDPMLVRGLDYYTRTLFEFSHDGLGAQSAIGGGGRYDGLLETIGGQALPGVGFGLGVDRTLLACQAEGMQPGDPTRVDVFAVPIRDDAKRQLVVLVTQLRQAGVRADLAYGGQALKGAMKAADRSGARWAVVAGDRDLAQGVVQVKDLHSGEQEPQPLSDVVDVLRGRLQ